jgi:replicative DNA helicase
MALVQKEIEERLLSSLRTTDDLSKLVTSGVTPDYFIIYNDVFKFIQKYHSKYGNIPSADLLKSNYSNLTVLNTVPANESEYLTNELIKSNVQRGAIRVLNTGADLLSQDVYGGLDYLVSKLQSIRKEDKKYCVSYTDKDALHRFPEYEERKTRVSKGMHLGLKTGFSIFDDNNIGWMDGNLVSIIGRLGIGKSFLLEYSGCAAYASDHRVTYLSPEMSINEVELRWDTMMSAFYNYSFPNDDLISGKINSAKYKEWLTEISKKSAWVTMDSNHGKPFTIPAIEAIVDEFSPHLLCIDGFLELRSLDNRLEKSWETMLDVAYGLKAIAQNKKIVIMVTSQANRQAAGKMPEIQHVYGGDSLAQASDVMMMLQDDEKEPNIRYISIPKIRGQKSFTKRIKLNFAVNVGKIGG